MSGSVLNVADVEALWAEAAELSSIDPRRGPIPAIVDTDFVRRGLHYQLRYGIPPKSVRMARRGTIRLVMDYDTLTETGEKLTKFSRQFRVPAVDLRRVLNEQWLQHIQVVKVPMWLRESDPRALAVRDRDRDDFPAAALAALLSPCLLFTHNYQHFGLLGVHAEMQCREGMDAVVEIGIGEARVQAILTIPAVPVQAVGATMKWATGRFGPAAWIAGAVLMGGVGFWLYRQPADRRDRIKAVAAQIGKHFLDEYQAATGGVHQARLQLRASMIPRPAQRTPASAIMRELAVSRDSLSAAQIAELLDPTLRPSVTQLRAFLRAYDTAMFEQVRRGGYVLGSHYELPG